MDISKVLPFVLGHLILGKKPEVMPFVLRHLINTEEARGYAICFGIFDKHGRSQRRKKPKVMPFVLIIENQNGSENFDGRSNLKLKNEIMDNLINTMINCNVF